MKNNINYIMYGIAHKRSDRVLPGFEKLLAKDCGCTALFDNIKDLLLWTEKQNLNINNYIICIIEINYNKYEK